MFGGGLFGGGHDPFASLFNDPFFRDPFRNMESTYAGGFSGQSQAQGVPLHRSRTAPVIEEVHEADHHMVSGQEPVVEEPDDEDPAAHRLSQRQRTTYQQPVSYARVDPVPTGDRQLSSFGPHPIVGSIFDSFFGSAFSGIQQMQQQMQQMSNQHGATSYSYSSSTVTHGGPSGITYSKSHTTRTGPGGVRESQSTVHDGRTGEKSMTISRALGDKERTVTRIRDATGQEKRDEILRGLNHEEAERFDSEWVSEAEQKLLNMGSSGRSVTQRNSNIPARPLHLPAPTPQHPSSFHHATPLARNPMEVTGSGMTRNADPMISSVRGRDRAAAVMPSAPHAPAAVPSTTFRGSATTPSSSGYGYPLTPAGGGWSRGAAAYQPGSAGYGPGTTHSPPVTNMCTGDPGGSMNRAGSGKYV